MKTDFSLLSIIKRDGKKEIFNKMKIRSAVMQAGASEGLAIDVAQHVENFMLTNQIREMPIDYVQKKVEDWLMDNHSGIARSYIEYRSERDRIREKKSSLTQAIESLIGGSDLDTIKENANKSFQVFPTKRDLMSGVISKHFARNYILPKHIVAAHDSGLIHQHDLDYTPFLPYTNCCLVDLGGMLERGFDMGAANIEKPRSIGVACAIMAQVTAQVASHQYGGTTFANVDKVLAQYVRMSYDKHIERAKEYEILDQEKYAEKMTEKEVYDAFQAYQYEILTLFSTNGQTPFVTLTFGMETGWEGRMIQKAILNNRIQGIGKDHITPTFPKLVMFVEDGINLKKCDINYDIKLLAVECAAKRFYPDIINAKVNREITGSSVPVSPMGCRSFLSVWKDENGKEVLDGRNNLGVVSLNLPRIALDSGNDIEEFWKLFDARISLVKDALDFRINQYEDVPASVAPILYSEGGFGVRLKPEDSISELFKNGRSSISMGYVGLHETLKLLTGKGMHECKDVHDLGVSIIHHMKDVITRWKKEDGYGYALYATPAESLCYRFAKLDKKVYGEISGVNELDYYTNSHHVAVTAKISPFEKIELEQAFPSIANGGNISYVEFPNMKNNLEGLESVWDYVIASGAHYFGTNTPSDTCFECKFEGEMVSDSHGFTCPSCGNNDRNKMNAIRRTCGYLGNNPINEGKMQEIGVRYKHFTSQAL